MFHVVGKRIDIRYYAKPHKQLEETCEFKTSDGKCYSSLIEFKEATDAYQDDVKARFVSFNHKLWN